MGRKAKISYEIKIKFVEEYLNGNISQNGIAKELGLHISSIQEWIRKYKIFGPEGLRTLKNNTYYNSDLKLSAVKDYINGIGSLADICLKYSISSTGILKQWISKYNKCHKICKSHNKKGDHINRILTSNYNHKRIYRLMKSVKLAAVIRRKKKRYIQSTPQITAENILNREFVADSPNEKWLTDITEFKLTNGNKAYLSAILAVITVLFRMY